MDVFLASLSEADASPILKEWRDLASQGSGCHGLVDDPERADVVLFTQGHELANDWRMRAIAAHPITRRYREKVYVFNMQDQPWCAFAGLYVSQARRGFERRYQVPWAYHRVRNVRDELPAQAFSKPDLLYSFIGGPTHALRRSLFELHHRDAIVEEATGFYTWDASSSDWAARRRRYAEVTGRSRFILCPRGQGTATFRLFEAMAAGRCPVILSDEWLPPPGPRWSACSIRWPEHALRELPAYLEGLGDEWRTLGEEAGEAFATWFAPTVAFERAIDALSPLVEAGAAARIPPGGARGRSFWRLLVREMKNRVRTPVRAIRQR